MEEATNGLEAVRTFEAWPDRSFDLILMDLSMPILDGMGAMSAIRQTEAERYSACSASARSARSSSNSKSQNNPTSNPSRSSGVTHLRYPKPRDRVKMFALTGRSTEQDMRKAIASGADGYMVKPMSITTYVLFS